MSIVMLITQNRDLNKTKCSFSGFGFKLRCMQKKILLKKGFNQYQSIDIIKSIILKKKRVLLRYLLM